MRCQCIKKDLKQCNYQSKPHSQFCGVHKTCKTIMESEPIPKAIPKAKPKAAPIPKAKPRPEPEYEPRPEPEPEPEPEYEPEPEQPNAFDVLPKELIERVLSFANAQDLHQIEQVDRRLWYEVQDKYRSYVRKARKLLGVHAKPLTDAQLMLRVKHLSDGQHDATGIQIVDLSDGYRWEKGSQSVTVMYWINGNVKAEAWAKNKKYHRLDGPAHIKWYDNGNIETETWYTGVLGVTRLDGPARTHWFDNGQKMEEEWYVEGRLHRLDGPTITMWYRSGRKQQELWYDASHGSRVVLHRLNGPAVTVWSEFGRKTEEQWYEYGESVQSKRY
jgi:hypothetical protein